MTKRSYEDSLSSAGDDARTPASSAWARSPSAEPPPSKVAASETSDQFHDLGVAMQCLLPPHREPINFESIKDFEVHYAKDHSNRCVECSRNFPTSHFLALHLDENHNPVREVLQSQGEKTYACFIEDCDRKRSTPQKRRLHLIDKHMFPKLYNFRVVDNGIDRSTSMLKDIRQRRRLSTVNDDEKQATFPRRRTRNHSIQEASGHTEVSNGESANGHKAANTLDQPSQLAGEQMMDKGGKSKPPSESIDDLARSMSSLSFVPPSVSSRQRSRQPNG